MNTGIVMLAFPVESSGSVPRFVAPSITETVPVGWIPTDETTLMLKVTVSPYTDGFSELVTVVVTTPEELALVMTCVVTVEVIAEKSESPLYCAVRE